MDDLRIGRQTSVLAERRRKMEYARELYLKGLSLREIAKLCGMSHMWVQNVITGRQKLPVDNFALHSVQGV